MKFQNIKSTTFFLFLITSVILAIAHSFAVMFSLYWVYLWFDIPMHFLGGIVVALGFLSLTRVHVRHTLIHGLVLTAGVVLVVGIGWEVFEHMTNTIALERSQGTLVRDTIGDLVVDVLGGIVGYGTARTVSALD